MYVINFVVAVVIFVGNDLMDNDEICNCWCEIIYIIGALAWITFLILVVIYEFTGYHIGKNNDDR